jgi:hypothetical protein
VLENVLLSGLEVYSDGVAVRLASQTLPGGAPPSEAAAAGSGDGSGGTSSQGGRVQYGSTLTTRLLLDCMGHASPIVKQLRWVAAEVLGFQQLVLGGLSGCASIAPDSCRLHTHTHTETPPPLHNAGGASSRTASASWWVAARVGLIQSQTQQQISSSPTPTWPHPAQQQQQQQRHTAAAAAAVKGLGRAASSCSTFGRWVVWGGAWRRLMRPSAKCMQPRSAVPWHAPM